MDPAPSTAGFNSDLANVLSPSQVNTWLGCNAAWYFKHFRNLPDTTDAKRALGNAVDAALSANFKQKIRTRMDLDREQVLNLFARAWAEQLETAALSAGDDKDELGRQGAVLVQKYLAEAAPAILPIAVQEKLAGTIAGVRVSCRIDLMDTDGRIIELKTSGAKPDKIRPAHAFQLATYRQVTPGASGRVLIQTLVRTKKPQLIEQPYTVTDSDVRHTQTMYPLVQEQMRSGLYAPNRSSMYCSRKSCAFWQACEREFGGSVPEGKCDA